MSRAMQTDLFTPPLLPGLALAADFLAQAEEQALITHIDGAELSPFRFQQWTGKRLTCSYGWSYDFETGRFGTAEPIPEWLEPLKIRAAAFAGLAPTDIAQALLIRYDPGAGIGWHKDRPVFEHIIGISLGATAQMRFRQRGAAGFMRAIAPLLPRSIYHLTGEARHLWEHSIAALEEARWSITFRTLVKPG